MNLATQVGWAVLIFATLYVCYFSHLGAIGFVGPDEPRYAWIARDMAETGDWVTPRLYGKPWFEKPPLFYWGAALSFKLLGVSETAARLPSAISALLATLALAWLAWRLYGAETARGLLLLLPTTVGMIGFSHAAATDMTFSGMLTIAMVCAAVVLGLTRNENTPIIPRTPWLAFTLFGFFLGLAVLAKGPAATILSSGAVFFWAVFTKRWRDAFRLFHPAAIAAFCLTALPWYMLCARRNPDFFRIFIIEHNFKRFLTPEFQHIQPFWYYLPITLVAVFPWFALLLPLASQQKNFWKMIHPEAESRFLLLAWAGFTILFFSVSKSKLPGYILPAVPPLMLVLAEQCTSLAETAARIRIWTGSILALSILGVSAVLFKLSVWNFSKVNTSFDGSYGFFGRLPLFVFLAGGACSVAMAVGGRTTRAIRVAVLTVVVGLATYDAGALSLGDLSVRGVAIPEGRVAPVYSPQEVAIFKLRRSYAYSLNFYFHRELPEWSPGENQFRLVFTDFKSTGDAQSQGLLCYTRGFGVVWTPVVVCENPNSVNGPTGSGKLQ